MPLSAPAPAPPRVRAATPGDHERWDAFVLGEAGGNLLQTWAWAELKREHGWAVDRMVVAAGPDGDLAGALQLLSRPGPGGVLSFAYAPRGPAVPSGAAGVAPAVALIEAAARVARRRRALVLKLDPEWGVDDPHAAAIRAATGLRDSAYDVQHRLTYAVDLSGGAGAVLERVKASTRRHIRRAQSGGVAVEIHRDPAAAGIFHPLLEATVRRNGFVARDLAYHRALLRHLPASCPVATLIARVEGTPVSGMVAPAAEGAGPRVSRFTLLAASLALAAALGGMAGALAAYGLARPGPLPAVAAGRTNLDEIQALKENVVQARVELAALKVSIDSANRNAGAQFTRIGERIERIERIQAEPTTKLNKAVEMLDRMARGDGGAQPKEVTGSVAPSPPAHANGPNQPSPKSGVEGWVVRDVHRGTALIEGRMGMIEVEQGDLVPGLGRVDAIRKQDGRWVVVTSRGLITSGR
jgi:hypothetical protein